MELRAAIVPYMDEDGLVIERPNKSDGPETGNGIRERCALELLCLKRRESTPAHVEDFIRVIRSCEATSITYQGIGVYNVEPIPGLYNRGPRKPGDKAAHDDRRCLSAVSSILNVPFAKEMHDYGKRNWWSFNNLKPNTFSLRDWDYRFPGVVPCYRINAGKKYLPLEDLGIGVGILSSALSKKPGQKIMWWMQVEALELRGLFPSETRQWWDCLRVQFGGLAGAFAAYYETEDHPFVQLCPF